MIKVLSTLILYVCTHQSHQQLLVYVCTHQSHQQLLVYVCTHQSHQQLLVFLRPLILTVIKNGNNRIITYLWQLTTPR